MSSPDPFRPDDRIDTYRASRCKCDEDVPHDRRANGDEHDIADTSESLQAQSSNPRRDLFAMDEPADDDEATAAESVGRHGHQLSFS